MNKYGNEQIKPEGHLAETETGPVRSTPGQPTSRYEIRHQTAELAMGKARKEQKAEEPKPLAWIDYSVSIGDA